MMKSWNSAAPTSPLSPQPPRGPSIAPAPLNEATRKWIAAPEPASSIPTRGGAAITQGQMRVVSDGTTNGGGVFGRSLREAVVLTRLAQWRESTSYSNAPLSALDLGSEFSINLPGLASDRRLSPKHRVAVNREEARQRYLPAVVVRCIEAIERWGVEEEGIYRLSGRSSHTAKLKIIFDNANRQMADLELVDIGPADLDLNSVCSLLKAYLRALPDLLLTSALSNDFNEAVRGACGISAVSEMASIRKNQGPAASTTTPPSTPGTQSQRVARAIKPLMNRLPSVNWYLLREIAYHLGDLTRDENVRKTKMTLSNLCLVLAPTLSLSVAMVRMLVEGREDLFGDTCPLPDSDLDGDQINAPPLPSRAAKASHMSHSGYPREISRPSSRMWDNGSEKRTSIATLKYNTDLDKRDSTSSMATLQEASLKASNENDRIRPTSDIFHLPGYSMSIRASPASSDDDSHDAPPIAAQYLRKRSSSIANSIGSTQASSAPSSRSMQISKLPSSTSLYSNALHAGSTIDSSVPSSADRDSPRMADDHWPVSVSNSANLEGGSSSSSSGSLSSNYKSSGALDRPRPTTPNPMRFFSSASRA